MQSNMSQKLRSYLKLKDKNLSLLLALKLLRGACNYVEVEVDVDGVKTD